MIPVIVSGGSGTRLWPVSRKSFPKQFCELLDETLFAKTVKRLQPLGSPWSVTGSSLKVLTERSLRELGVPVEQCIYEPVGRNTAPAIALLARVFQTRGWEKETVGVFPADHLVANEEEFRRALRTADRIAAQGEIVTIGLEPTHPATGYGYIETSGPYEADALVAVGFHEKPNEAKAREFISRGGFYWNSGTFVFRVDRMIELLRAHAPDIWSCMEKLKSDLSNLEAVYGDVRAVSIDYAVMEKLSRHVCIPCDCGWNDIGSWDAFADVTKSAPDAVTVDSAGCFVRPVQGKTYALVGVRDLLVVDTTDALLIAEKGRSEKVKDAVDALAKAGSKAAFEHDFEVRPWGRFEILRDTEQFKSKVIEVDPAASISYQSHAKRAEHWIVVQGTGEVTLDDKIIPVGPGTHVHIPIGAKHRIRNTGKIAIRFVEVQLGSYFGEDDIVRYSDVYGRS